MSKNLPDESERTSSQRTPMFQYKAYAMPTDYELLVQYFDENPVEKANHPLASPSISSEDLAQKLINNSLPTIPDADYYIKKQRKINEERDKKRFAEERKKRTEELEKQAKEFAEENRKRYEKTKLKRRINQIIEGQIDIYPEIEKIDSECIQVLEQSEKDFDSKIKKITIKFSITKILLFIFYVVLSISLTFSLNLLFRHEVEGLNTICYTTNTGECYHASYCRYLRNSSNKTNVYKAKQKGYRSCSRCSVGILDKSIKDEYEILTIVSFSLLGVGYYYVYKRINNVRDSKINNETKFQKDITKYITDMYKKKIEAIANGIPLYAIIKAPKDSIFIDALPQNKNFRVYSDYFDSIYHSKANCSFKDTGILLHRQLRARHILDVIEESKSIPGRHKDPCPECMPIKFSDVPDWCKRAWRMHRIAKRYKITFENNISE